MVQLIDPTLLSTWLATQPEKFLIVEATWLGATATAQAKEIFLAKHIRGAQFFDLNAFQTSQRGIPNQLELDATQASQRLQALGVELNKQMVFYDQSEWHTSCRALWICKVFNYPLSQCYLLDGTIDTFAQIGGPLASGEELPLPVTQPYQAILQERYIRTRQQMQANLHQPVEQVIDMRHAIAYVGMQQPGLRAGHLPGSFSFPYLTMFDEHQRWKPLPMIQQQLRGIGVDLNVPIVTMCGTGMTAAVLNAALDLMGHSQHALYDGSYAEWGTSQLYPGEVDLTDRSVVTSLS